MKHPVELETRGGWGYPSPAAFAFDLSKAAAWKAARKSGVRRYGRAASDGDDTRPIAPAYYHAVQPAWIERGGVQAAVGNIDRLEKATAPFGGAAGLAFVDGKRANRHRFTLPVTLVANESFAFRGFVHNVDGGGEEKKGHVWQVKIGAAGAGVMFQIRDGSPEIARLSRDWSSGEEEDLQTLWALDEPSADDEEQIAALTKRLYSSFESLSFERSTGRDAWRGGPFFLTLIPEPRGALHIVLEGADATMIEFPDILKTRELATIWGAGAGVEIGATGGAWFVQPLGVRFRGASMEFGPYLVSGDLGAAQFSSSAYSHADEQGNRLAQVQFERNQYAEQTEVSNPDEPTATPFTFKATFSSSDNRYGAWLYGLSARLENGPRTGLEDDLGNGVTFTSADLTGDDFETRDSKPILDVTIDAGEDGRRTATVTMRDLNGATTRSIVGGGGIDGLVGRVAYLTKTGPGGGPLFSQALITRGRLSDAAHFAGEGGSREGEAVSKAKTRIELTLCDGHQILSETLCDPPVISDKKRLGVAIRQRLRLSGYSQGEMARVPADLGPILPFAAPGEDWATISDAGESVSASIEGLLDRFGYGLRFYQDENGVWVLERRPTVPIAGAAFVSQSAQNDPNLTRGGTRYTILSPLDWERDHENYFTTFRVIGGAAGEIVRDWVDRNAMTLEVGAAPHPRWLGRPKVYPTLVDTGLRTLGQVLYALRSLVDRYCRPGRMATFETYFVRQFVTGDLITVDGIECEIVSWSADLRRDRMQIQVREKV